jgi:hypothetical protein
MPVEQMMAGRGVSGTFVEHGREGKIGELIAKSGYELSGLSPITPRKYELLTLAFRNKRFRIHYNIRKYGIILYFSRFLAERLGWQALLTSCKRKYSAIDIKGLK